ncbi:MAG: TonB-dependent receptor [Acidobacteriia bacterium]|nr:TonB-dependent receptor [Terriglobia bacterium]
MTATNSALNAAPFSLNGQSQPKPSSARESVAGNIGGPLRIPKLTTNDKWQVYLNVSVAQNRNARNQVSTVPTLAERNGDFSAAVVRNAPVTIYDPLNNAPFPGNIIPSTRFNSASVGLLQYFPAPLFDGIVQNYSIAPSTPSDSHSVGFRLSGAVTTKDRLNFNQQFSGSGSTNEQLFGFQDTSNGYGLSSTAGWSHSFKPRFNNSANFSFSRNVNKAAPFFAYGENVAADLGILGPDQTPINYGPPNLSFTNFGSLTDGSASVNRSQTVNFADNVTYVVHRNHNITFGLGYRRMQQNALSYANSRGSFSFGGLLTSGIDSSGKTLPNTGFDFADFLLGYPQTSSLRIGNSNNYFRGWAASGYVQDDWRINRGLTLNLGLRYEYFSPYTELFGHLANLDLNSALTAVSVVTAGGSGPYSGQFPNSLVHGDPNNFSPRIGFAWRPTQKHSRIIRGGYSIFYSGSSYPQMAARMAAQPPFARTGSLATSLTDPLTLQDGFPAQPSSTITNTYAVDKNYKLAYAQTWTIAVQQTLPHNVLMELEYVGTKGTGLDIVENPNQTPPGAPAATAQQVANANAFTYETDHANSIFHAGQVRMTRRFTRGMSAVALYTFSKSIDNASSFTGGGGGTLVQNPLNLAAERGLSSSDQRHRLTLTYLLSSPVGIHGFWRNGGWKTRLLTGWTLNGTFTANSGQPLTAYISGNLAGTTKGNAISGNFRAEATGESVDSGAFSFFNENAFVAPSPGEYGNAGRNTIPGPALISVSGALNRAWRFGDTRRQLQLRLSANNVLNHVQITGFGTTVNSATYGLPTAASATRSVTLNLRFGF